MNPKETTTRARHGMAWGTEHQHAHRSRAETGAGTVSWARTFPTPTTSFLFCFHISMASLIFLLLDPSPLLCSLMVPAWFR